MGELPMVRKAILQVSPSNQRYRWVPWAAGTCCSVSCSFLYHVLRNPKKKKSEKKEMLLVVVGCCWYGSMAISWISRLYLLSVVVQFFVTVNVVVIVTSTDHGPQIDDG